jgi:hypothetical protein
VKKITFTSQLHDKGIPYRVKFVSEQYTTPVGVWQTGIDVVYVGAVIVIDLVVDLVQGTLL